MDVRSSVTRALWRFQTDTAQGGYTNRQRVAYGAAAGGAALLLLVGPSACTANSARQPSASAAVSSSPWQQGQTPTQPSTTAVNGGPVVAAATGFASAWLSAPTRPAGAEGDRVWRDGMRRHVDDGLWSLLAHADRGQVPTHKAAPVTVVWTAPGGEIGGAGTVTFTLSNGDTLDVTVNGGPDGWRVSEYRHAPKKVTR